MQGGCSVTKAKNSKDQKSITEKNVKYCFQYFIRSNALDGKEEDVMFKENLSNAQKNERTDTESACDIYKDNKIPKEECY